MYSGIYPCYISAQQVKKVGRKLHGNYAKYNYHYMLIVITLLQCHVYGNSTMHNRWPIYSYMCLHMTILVNAEHCAWGERERGHAAEIDI